MIIAVETIETVRSAPRILRARAGDEAARAKNYPLGRWWLRPLAGWLAARLVDTGVRPWHVTLCGLACALVAVGVLLWEPMWSPLAALAITGWWFCDRADGMLARLQGTASPLGAWLDGNVDELVDLGLHLAMAHAASIQGARWAWPLVIAFLFGKYLLMHGLPVADAASVRCADASSVGHESRIGYFYHLPGNADIRAHLVILALATGCLTAELALIAVYYNVRWIARYPLLIARARRQPA